MTTLRPGERTVLAVLASAQGRVVSREHLARRAGLQHASPRRVDALIVELRRNLGDDAIRTVRGRGWLLTKTVELDVDVDVDGPRSVETP